MFSLSPNPRFMLVGLVPFYETQEKMIADFEEVESLVETFGGHVHAVAAQNSVRKDQATFIGTGKAQEVADKIAEEKIDIIVINDNVKPGQLFTLKKIFERSNPDILVWDRIDLILAIFKKHAATAEAKLQIRLADIRHMGPRIYGLGLIMSQQGAGIGTRGIGETNTELMRRHWRQEIRSVRKELDKITQTKQKQMDRRKKSGLSTVSIVGYTNAGKTSLFNLLGKKKNRVENALFATLDSSVSRFFLASLKKEVYLSDTIGFIRNLPLQLVDAFKSTLLETLGADLLLHVIDVSDPWMNDKITTVSEILQSLSINTKNQIYVFNKIDKAQKIDREELSQKYHLFQPQFISAKTGQGLNILLETIQKTLPEK